MVGSDCQKSADKWPGFLGRKAARLATYYADVFLVLDLETRMRQL